MNPTDPAAPFNPATDWRAWLRQLAETAIAAAHPDARLPDKLPEPPPGRTVVIGAGKAAAAMAATLERAWSQQYPQAELSGLVVTRYGHGEPCQRIEVLEASHPMPDALGEQAATRMLETVRDLTEDDLVIALISGGGSALLTRPAAGITLAQKQAVNHALLRSGAPIRAINTVRRHLSMIKGGRMAAAAHPARVVTYLISDVPGDEPSLIASGPTLADVTTPRDALAILEQYAIDIPDAIRHHLQTDTTAPSPNAADFQRDQHHVLAKARDALAAAQQAAEACGITVRLLGDDLEGEARDLGQAHGELALTVQQDLTAPLLILSGGETSVTVRGDGRGGRNVEYLLGLFNTLAGASGVHALAIDTDGIDGSEDNAGALFGPEDYIAMQARSLDPQAYLARNDAYSFFKELGGLIVTGPTRTNVNDFRGVLVLPGGGE